MQDSSAGQLAALLALVSAFHQTLVELYKFFARPKEKRYFQGLCYIVFGDEPPPRPGAAAGPAARDSRYAEWRDETRLVPVELGLERRRRWIAGPQLRFVESLILRGVGDAPSSDISDADVENAVRLARAEAPDAARLLDQLTGLLNARVEDPDVVIRTLEKDQWGPAAGEATRLLDRLEEVSDPKELQVLLEDARRRVVQAHVPGEIRARLSLANVIKSAELRYHYDLRQASIILAAVQAGVITWLWGASPFRWLVPIVVFATAVLGSQAGKSLLDLVIGLGKRIRA